jgi:hypothetical protein
MRTGDEIAFPSFWTLQAAGWIGLYVIVALAGLPFIAQRPAIAAEDAVKIIVWFLASCPLRWICRGLVRRPLPWMSMELRALAGQG